MSGLPGLQSQGQASKGRIERPADHPAPPTLQNMLGLSFPIWIVNCTQHHMRAGSMSRAQSSSDGDHGCLLRLRVRIHSPVSGTESHLSVEPLALVRSRCWKSPWNCGSWKASRQLGILRETSHSSLSNGVCVDLRGQDRQSYLTQCRGY